MGSVKDKLKRIFEKTKADVIFLMNTDTNDSNFTYLAGFTSGNFEYTVLIATRKGLVLPVNVLEYEIAKERKPLGMKVIKVSARKQIRAIMARYMKGKVVGVNESFLPYSQYASIKKNIKPKRIINVYDALAGARSVKDSDELSRIKIANKIAKKALESARRQLKVGMSEKEVAAIIDYNMMKLGASGPSFPSIVSFNSNSAMPHHMPDGTKLAKNSIVLMDIGAKYNNYCSDITRTFMFRPDTKSSRYRRFMDMHRVVSEAQALGLKNIRDGIEGSAAHIAAAEHIDNASGGIYKGKFIHALGHAIGIEVHDVGGYLSSGVREKLKANMVVSDEPGIYIVGFGGVRIEDDVIVTKKGAIML